MEYSKYLKNAQYLSSSVTFFPYIRKSFNLTAKVKRAKLYVSALGFCEIFLNDKKVTENLYVTTHSMYNPQKPDEFYVNPSGLTESYLYDKLGYTVYVNEFTVTEMIKEGTNALGFLLSGGWYYTEADKYGNYRNFGVPKVAFLIKIEYEDGKVEEIVSDFTAKSNYSFLIKGGIYHEEQDERREIKDFSAPEYNDESWYRVQTSEGYSGAKYKINDCPPNRIIRYYTPELIKETANEKIYKTPINITGYPIIKSEGKAGERIVVRYGEELDAEGNLDEFHAYDQHTVFITDERKEHRLRMTWHGFRYFSVTTTGDLSKIICDEVALIHADIKNTSSFKCNDEVINFVYDSYVLTQQENYQCGVPTDCPQIERKGYTGDGQLLANVGMMLFDSKKLYRKWLVDISDCQDRKSGFVHNTAPVFMSCGGGPGGWSVAIINVPYAYYKAYGDKEVIREYYPQMKKYCEFIDDESQDNLVTIRKRSAACLGDWNGPVKPLLPEPFANSCMYVEAMYNMIEIAKAIGKDEDIARLEKRIEEVKSAINREYYNEETGDYCNNEQGSNAFAINIGLGDKRTIENLAKRYDEFKGFDTGIFGTKYLPKILFKNGYGDIALKLYNSDNKWSYKGWKEAGETTMLEAWVDARSHNHPMFGSTVEYLFTEVLGINQGKKSAGYEEIEIRPLELKEITEVEGSIETVKGEIKVKYAKKKEGTEFEIEVPMESAFSYGEYTTVLLKGENKFFVKK